MLAQQRSVAVPLPLRLAATVSRRIPIRGRSRVAWRLQKFATRRDWASHAVWRVPMWWGGTATLPSGSRQSWEAAFTGTYDTAEIRFLRRFIEPQSLIIDVGACLGLYSVPLALVAGSVDARVLAIEPVPANVQVLTANLRANEVQKVATVSGIAVGAREGIVDLRVESRQGGNGAIADLLEE